MSPLVPIIGGLLVLVVIAANDWRRNRPPLQLLRSPPALVRRLLRDDSLTR